MPDFDLSANGGGELATGRRKNEGRHGRLEGKVVEGYAPRDVGENGAAILVDGEQEIALGI